MKARSLKDNIQIDKRLSFNRELISLNYIVAFFFQEF